MAHTCVSVLSCLNRSSCPGFLHGFLPSASQEKATLTYKVKGQLPNNFTKQRRWTETLLTKQNTLDNVWTEGETVLFLVFYGSCQFPNDSEW